MAGACPPFSPQDEFLRSLLSAVDCHAQTIGQAGYQALATPGSAVSLGLTALLTIFVALFGYRMLLGQAPDAREGVVAAAKIGVVLALATSWPAFRTLAYDVTMHGPAELAASIGQQASLPGAGGGLVERLQGVDNELAELTVLGTGKPPEQDEVVGPNQPLTPEQQQREYARLQQLQQRPRWNPADDAKLVGEARTLYLTGAIAAFASVRLVAGLLLALGPLFAIFLLFDNMRGLFEGWIRGLVGAALGSLATAIVLGVELALLEPWMAAVVSARRADIPTPTVPVELLVTTLVFALTLVAALIATAKVARGFRMTHAMRVVPQHWVEGIRSRSSELRAVTREGAAAAEAPDQRSRAFALADAVAATQRREAAAPLPPAARLGPQRVGEAARRDNEIAAAVPLGQSWQRRTRGRVSAGAARRDRKA
ncbi:MAG TPA: type IV secretion system protein [Allosphingosinicella sp.]|jgi:type IV secretion system protein VirB6